MAFEWVIAGVVVVILVTIIMKSQDLVFIVTLIKKNFFNLIAIALILFLAFSLFNIQETNDLDLTTADGIGQASLVYLNWAKDIGKNLVGITGYVVEQDWWLNETSSNGEQG